MLKKLLIIVIINIMFSEDRNFPNFNVIVNENPYSANLFIHLMSYNTQNNLLLNKLMEYYRKNNNIDRILPIINGEHTVSLRLIDWFVTNYSKKNFTQFSLDNGRRFKIYVDYKLF